MIGSRIRQARMRGGVAGRRLTQAALAAALDVARSHLTNVENGKDRLSLDKLAIVATETDTTIAWLLGESNTMGPRSRAHADLLAAFDAMDEEHRQAFLTMAKGLAERSAASSASVPGQPPKKNGTPAPRQSRRAACIIAIPFISGDKNP